MAQTALSYAAAAVQGPPHTALERVAATGLLAHLWPAEKVLMGMCVCQMLNAALKEAPRIQIKIGRAGVALPARRAFSVSASVTLCSPTARMWAGQAWAGSSGMPAERVLKKLEGAISVCTRTEPGAGRPVSDDWRSVVCDVMSKFRSRIERLELRNFGLGDQCFVIDEEMTNLHELDLGYNKIPGTMLRSIAALENLQVLRLSHNSLGTSSASALSQALLFGRCAKSLTLLDIGGNEVGDSGLSHISLCLAGLSQLKSLLLSHNLIGDRGVCDLVSWPECPAPAEPQSPPH